MIIRIEKDEFNIVKSDEGKKIRVKGHKGEYSEGTEFTDKPLDYEEVEAE